MLALLDEIAFEGRILFDAQLSVFRKTWLSLSGVLTDLAGDALPDTVLLNAGLKTFLAEWPTRWSGASAANQLASHVSNADLVTAMIVGWSTGARYWQRVWMR